jgi:hypothetical protein
VRRSAAALERAGQIGPTLLRRQRGLGGGLASPPDCVGRHVQTEQRSQRVRQHGALIITPGRRAACDPAGSVPASIRRRRTSRRIVCAMTSLPATTLVLEQVDRAPGTLIEPNGAGDPADSSGPSRAESAVRCPGKRLTAARRSWGGQGDQRLDRSRKSADPVAWVPIRSDRSGTRLEAASARRRRRHRPAQARETRTAARMISRGPFASETSARRPPLPVRPAPHVHPPRGTRRRAWRAPTRFLPRRYTRSRASAPRPSRRMDRSGRRRKDQWVQLITTGTPRLGSATPDSSASARNCAARSTLRDRMATLSRPAARRAGRRAHFHRADQAPGPATNRERESAREQPIAIRLGALGHPILAPERIADRKIGSSPSARMPAAAAL